MNTTTTNKAQFNFTTVTAADAAIRTILADGSTTVSYFKNNWMTETAADYSTRTFLGTTKGVKRFKETTHGNSLVLVDKDLVNGRKTLYIDPITYAVSGTEIIGSKFFAYKTLHTANLVVFVEIGSAVGNRIYPRSTKDQFSVNHNQGSDIESIMVKNGASFVHRYITNVKVSKERADLITKGESCKIATYSLSRDLDGIYSMGTTAFLQVGYDRLIKEANNMGKDMKFNGFFEGPTKIGTLDGGTNHIDASEMILANTIRVHQGDELNEEFNKPGARIKVNTRLASILVPGVKPNTTTMGWINTSNKKNTFVLRPSSNYVTYEWLCTSTSEVKGDSEGGISTWIAVKDDVSTRAFDVINTAIPNFIENKAKCDAVMAKNKALTFGSRVGLAKMAGKEYNLSSVGEFQGLFDATINPITGKSNNCMDGGAIASHSMGRKMGISKRALKNLVLQARIHGVYKMQIIFVPDSLYKEICDYLRVRGTINVRGLNKNVQYPDLLVDDNIIKAEIDIDVKDIVLTVKAVGHRSKAKFINKQVIQKVLFEAANMGQTSFDNAMEYFKDKGFDTLTDGALAILDPSYAPVLGDSDFNISNSLLSGPASMDRKLRNAYIGMAKTINKLHIAEDESYNAVVAGDLSCIFGVQILSEKEVLFGELSKEMSRLEDKDPVALAEFIAKYAVGLVFKYPSMGLKEFITINIVSTNYVCGKVDANTVLTKGMKEGLKEYYSNIADATVMFAAFEATFKSLAGMDIDFDKCQIIFNKFFNSILAGKEELINISSKRVTAEASVRPKNVWSSELTSNADAVMDSKREARFNAKLKIATEGRGLSNPNMVTLRDPITGKYNYNFFYNAYVVYRKMAGSVGLLTNANDKIISMATMAKLGDWSACDQFLKELFGATTAEIDTFVMDESTIDPNSADRAVELMGKCKWTDANKMAFMVFCNKLFRLYQESCIDSTKTGIYIACVITNASIKVRSLVRVKFDYENSKVKFADFESIKINVVHVDGTKDQMDTTMFEDAMGEISTYLVGETEAIVAKTKATIGYTKEELAEFQKNIALALRLCPQTFVMLHTLKKVHVGIREEYRNNIKAMAVDNKSEDEKELLMEVYKNHLVTALANLSSLVKQTVDKKLYKTASEFDSFELCGKILDAVSNTRLSVEHEYQGYAGNFAIDCYKDSLLAGKAGSSYKLFGTVIQDDEHVLDNLMAVVPTSTISLSFIDGTNSSFGSTIVLKERYTGEVTFDGANLYVEEEIKAGKDELHTKAVIVDSAKIDSAINKLISSELGKQTTAFSINSQITRNSVIQLGKGCVYFWSDKVKDSAKYVTVPVIVEFSNLEVGQDYFINEVVNIKNNERRVSVNAKSYYGSKDSYYLTVVKA